MFSKALLLLDNVIKQRFYTGLIFLFFGGSILSAQEVDSTRVNNTILPIVFYLPETGLGFGATGITTFRFKNESLESTPSQFLYSAAYTLKNQFLFYVPFELYAQEASSRYKGELGFYKYFYNYYGIGGDSDVEQLENYNVTFPRIDFLYSYEIWPQFYAGMGLKYDYFNITSIKENGLLDTQKPNGYQGGHKLNTMLSLRYDKRDRIISSSSGFIIDLSIQRSLNGLFSDFKYSKLDFFASHFHRISSSWVWANDVYFAHASNDTPFFDLPYLSNPNRARGFSDRRYINYKLMNYQTEVRFPIKHRFKGAAFTSLAFIPEKWNQIFDASPKWAYGIGLRYEFDELDKTRFRLDLAFGEGDFNIYLTANEAF